MDHIEREFQEFCRNVNELKVTERKRKVDLMHERLQDEDVIDMLNKNSASKGASVSWNNIFIASHQALKKEAERFAAELRKEKKTSTLGRDNVNYMSLVIAIVHKANSGSTPFLMCSDVVSCCFEVLERNVYKKVFGEGYVRVLQQVLCIPLYWGEISVQHWNDLFNITIDLYKNPPDNCTKGSIVELLNYIIYYGCAHSDLALRVKKRFSLLVDIVKSQETRLQENVLHLALTFCQQLLIESRKAVCSFAEETMQILLNTYENRYDDTSKKKNYLIDLLVILVQAHHPNGATEGSDNALACDWYLWKKQLLAIYCLVQKELVLYQSSRKANYQLQENFIDLALSVMKQVYATCEDISGGLDVTVATMNDSMLLAGPSHKRKRIEASFQALIEQLLDLSSSKDPVIMWPWLAIFAEFILAFPDVINETQYVNMLTFLSGQMASQKVPVILNLCCRCCISLLKVETFLKSLDDRKDEVAAYWSQICDTTLRLLELNQCDGFGFELAKELLLVNKNFLSRLLQLFGNRMLRLSKHSLKVLLCLCRSSILQDELGSEKCKLLLHWIFPDKRDLVLKGWKAHILPPGQLALTVVGLVIRTKLPENCELYDTCEVQSDSKSRKVQHNLNSFENCVKDFIDDSYGAVKKESVVTVNWMDSACSELIQLISRDTELLLEQNTEDFLNFCVILFNHASLLIEIGTLFELYQCSHCKRVQDLLVSILNKIESVVNNLNQLQKSLASYKDIVDSVKLFGSYLKNASRKIALLVISFDFRQVILGFLWKIADPSNGPNSSVLRSFSECKSMIERSPLNYKLLNEKSCVQVDSMKAICFFVCSPHVCVKQDFTNILNLLKALSNEDVRKPQVLQMYAILLKEIVEMMSFNEEVIQKMLYSVRDICVKWIKVSCVAKPVIYVLQKMVVHVWRMSGSDNLGDFLVLIKGIYKRIHTSKFGAEIITAFVELIGKFIEIDWTGEWAKWDAGTGIFEQDSPVSNMLFSFIRNPFHQVRMAAGSLAGKYFSFSPKNEYQKLCFEKGLELLVSSLNQCFVIEGDLSKEESDDESVNRTFSALSTLANVLVISPRCHSRVLATLIEFSWEKNIKTSLVLKVLDCVGKKLKLKNSIFLIENNISNIFLYWQEKYKTFKEFPWTLTACSSEMEFYKKYSKKLVAVVIYKNDIKSFDLIEKSLELNKSELLKISYPDVMSFMLPLLLDGERSSNSHNHIILDNVQEMLGENVMVKLLSSHIVEIIVNVMRNLYDPDYFSKLCSISDSSLLLSLPDLGKLQYSYSTILKIFQFIKVKLTDFDVDLMVHLSVSRPDCIEKVLLHLFSEIHTAISSEFQLLSYYQYITMCELIGIHLNNSDMEELSTFIVCRIVHSLLHLTSQFYDSSSLGLLTVVLSYLEHFLMLAFPQSSIIINTLLHHIVAAIVPIAASSSKTTSKDICQVASRILCFLIVENHERLPGIPKLDPLPEDPQFETILHVYKNMRYQETVSSGEDSANLSYDIRHFLEAGKHNLNHRCRLEGLRYLKSQLSARKTELRELYSSLHTANICDDLSKSLLHQLICMLVGLISNSDAAVAREAARCLGELGPADLTTLVLQADTAYFCGKIEALYNQMAISLINFFLDPHIEVSQAASCALYAFVKTKIGFEAVRSLDEMKQKLLFPFTKVVNTLIDDSTVSVIQDNGKEIADAFRMMCPDEHLSHRQWITNLAQTLLQQFPKDSYLYQLIPACLIKVYFAEEIVLHLVHVIFLSRTNNSSKNPCIAAIIENIYNFLKLHFDSKPSDSNSESDLISDVYSNRASIRCVLNNASAVHQYLSSDDTTSSGMASYRQLNYLHIAKAAQSCSAFFTSVFYGELWFYSNFSELEDLDFLESSGSCALEYAVEKNSNEGIILQNLLYEAYKRIGDPDAVYGYASTQLFDTSARIQHYQLEGKWNRVMEAYDLELSKDSTSHPIGLALAIKSSGLDHLAGTYATVSNLTNDADLSDIQHECAWRLGQWALPECKTSYQGSVYSALKDISFSDSPAVANAVSEARKSVISSLIHTSLESTHSIYMYLSQLQSLQEIEDFEQVELKYVLEKWQDQDNIGWVNFEFIEPVIAQRIVLVGMRGEEDKVQVCLRGTMSALSESHYATAARCLHQTIGMPRLTIITQLKIKLEHAKVSWARGDTHIGKRMLRSLLAELRDVQPVELKTIHSSALRLYGSWMAEMRSENAEQIVKNYLIPAFEIASSCGDIQIKMEAMGTLARYTDQQYQALSQYIKSSDFQIKIDKVCKAGENIEHLKKSKLLTLDQSRATKIFSTQSLIDETEISNTRKAQENYLLLAMQHYLKYLTESDDNSDVHIFRVAALWLENKTNQGIWHLLKKHLKSIPSYKFLVVLPQLAAHITNSDDDFSKMLLYVFEKCAVQHPHHTLPLILALANSYKDSTNEQPKQTKKKKEEGRILGSEALLKKLLKQTKISSVVKGMSKLAEAYIHLANIRIDKKDTETVKKLSKSEPLLKLGSLPQVLVTTENIPFSKTADYSNIIGIQSFDNYFELVGGINKPKRIACTGTDGIKRFLLVKGNDDLRQDAVMMQVFTILNSLLRKNKRTRQRKLGIRTYKVVPMSQRSGVLEWCLNTKELGEYLTGKNGKGGAHHRYRPSDQPGFKCRQMMGSVAGLSKDIKFEKYKEVCKVIHPVMHHYFIENYATPGLWFEKRLAYTHSVACTSMIGYILGLGDRHVTNILIDKSTAELIHIDFGIAFEMGKCLPTPEAVPFRLTRDIVDGMGISGVEGVFRRCCEETMVVLRNSQDTLMTILEVLLYDPLFTWTVLPQRTVDQQMKSYSTSTSSASSTSTEVSSTEVNEWAERALLRLKQKLQGTEDGSTGPKSVEGQVEWLIQEARDPANLCCLFNGWQAFL